MKHLFEFKSLKEHKAFYQIPIISLRYFMGVLFVLFTCNLHSQVQWIGGADTNWNNPANWNPAVVPNATIPGTGVLTISANGPLLSVPDTIKATQLNVTGGDFMILAGKIITISHPLGNSGGVIIDNQTLTIDGKLIVKDAGGIGLEVMTDGILIVNDTLIVDAATGAGISLETDAILTNNLSGDIILRNNGAQGIENNGVINNEGTLLITDSGSDGIMNVGGSFTNDGTIKIFHSGGNGVENDGTTLFENSVGAILAISKTTRTGIEHGRNSTFNSFGLIAIDSTGEDGLFIDHNFFSMGDSLLIGTNHPCTGTGSGAGCAIGMNGINVASQGVHSVIGGSIIRIGSDDCLINEVGIFNEGMFMTDGEGTHIQIRSAPTSILNTGTIINNKPTDSDEGDIADGDCVIIDVDNVIAVNSPGTFDNSGIIITSAPLGANAVATGALDNNGFISDANGAFLTSLSNPRNANTVSALDNTDGILVAPYHGASYTSPLIDFLITGLNAPYENQYAAGAFINATFDDSNNELSLSGVSTSELVAYEIQKAATDEPCASLTTLITFDSAPTDEIACNSNIQLSLTTDGTATITPDMILESTHANADDFIVEILSGSGAGTNVVDCSYVGETVEVMVTAPGASGNRCWGRVTIEDKIGPALTINDTIFYCNQPYAPETLGFPVGTDACSAPVTYTYADKDSILTLCGEDATNPDTLRIITRTFVGRDQRWNATTITQTIYELRPTINSVVFPSSFTGEDALQCNSSNTATAITGEPYFQIGADSIPVKASCKFGVNMEEKVYDLGCPGKQRIERTWTVMDWCNLSSGAAISSGTQIIDIIDTIPPTFDSIKASDIVVLSTQSHKCMVTIRPPAPENIVETCSGATYRIHGPSGTIFNNPLDSLTNIPYDTTTLEYIVTDSCGNETRDTVTFILRDEVAPLALAQELTVNLVDGEGNTWVYAESFDAGSNDNCSPLDSILISKDGTNFADRLAFGCEDVGTLTLTLKVVDEAGNASLATREINVSDNGGFCPTTAPICNTAVVVDTAFITFSDPTDCTLTDGVLVIDASPIDVELQYSIDSGLTYFPTDTFINQDVSLKYVFVREALNTSCVTAYKKGPVGGCDSLNGQAAIAGQIQNENGETVESVNIAIGGYEMAPTITGVDGSFMFEEIPLEGDYMITPEKDMNHNNGITTFDIVLLSKHVLGLKKLDSPYKMIAADINHSGTISAYDMVLLRQVILGMKNDFPNNTSWRFIDAAYEFINPENPFEENYPEAYEIKDLSTDMMSLDFVAVKIGDLNNTAAVNQLQTTESRSTHKSLNFKIEEQVKQANETVTVDFKASNFQSILGYQFTLDFDGNDLKFEQIKMGTQTNFDNFNLSMIQRGIITTSWNESEAINLAKDEVLFSLVFKAKNDVRISEAISISSDITTAEAYTESEEVINVNLEVYTPYVATDGFKLYQNVPNPFTGETIIGFELPTASATTLTIFDMSGKTVMMEKGTFAKGYNQILIDGKAFDEHGMFYYQLETNQGIETKKMILLKR